MLRKTTLKLLATFLFFTNTGRSQQYTDISQIGLSVYSIMFVNEQDALQKKDMVDVHMATASSFMYKGKHFLACAKHSVEKFNSSGNIILYAIRKSKDSIIYQRGFVYYDSTLADVALIKPISFPGLPNFTYLTNNCVIDFLNKTLPLLSDLYLLGYPTYNTRDTTSVYESINTNHMYSPFYKKGVISGYDKSDSTNYKYFIDAYLSKGFSGGPAYHLDKKGKLILVGIITNTTVANILDSNYNTINSQYQNGGLTIITDARYLLTILKKNKLL
jgi:hypothetical protein